MSPAAMRRYSVSFIDWEPHVTIVLAADEESAISKAVALYKVNGMADFSSMEAESLEWDVELVEEEVQS